MRKFDKNISKEFSKTSGKKNSKNTFFCCYSCSFEGKMLQKYQKLWIWFWLSSRKVFRYLFFPPKLFHSFFWGDFSQFYLPLFAFHSSITLHCYRQHRRQQTALLRTWSKKIKPPKKKISRKEQIFVPFWEKKIRVLFSWDVFHK